MKELLVDYSLVVVVDSSEQVRERPKLYQEQKKFDSGKKKNHTLKNQLIVLPNGAEIVDVTVGKPGHCSDINLFRARQSEFAANQKFKGNQGYIGEVQIETPHKKPKKQELTAELYERLNNSKALSWKVFESFWRCLICSCYYCRYSPSN